MIRSFSTTVGLRRAAAIIFALVAVLPLLAVLPVLHSAGVLASPYAQVTLLLAVVLAVLGFFVLRRLTDQVARLAEGFANPSPGTAVPAATVPGLGRVTEIGQIGDALTHMLNDLRASTDRLEDLVFKLSTLNEVVELAARIPQMQDLLALVLERTMRTVRASIGSIMLLDHERQVLRVVVARGLPDDALDHAEVAGRREHRRQGRPARRAGAGRGHRHRSALRAHARSQVRLGRLHVPAGARRGPHHRRGQPGQERGGAAHAGLQPDRSAVPQHAHDPHRLRGRQRAPAAGSAAVGQPAATRDGGSADDPDAHRGGRDAARRRPDGLGHGPPRQQPPGRDLRARAAAARTHHPAGGAPARWRSSSRRRSTRPTSSAACSASPRCSR